MFDCLCNTHKFFVIGGWSPVKYAEEYIYGPKSKAITENCGMSHRGELYELRSFPSLVRATISRRMIFAGLMAYIWKIGWLPEGLWWREKKGKFSFGIHWLHGRIIVKWILYE